MKRDGTEVRVEVADDLSRVTVGGKTYEVRLVADGGDKVELEVAGEPVAVGAWPADCRRPPGPLAVNGETWPVDLEVVTAPGSGPRAPLPRAAPGAPSAPAPAPASGATPAGGTTVLPPMPGRVVEVRVHDGDTVAKGAVLVVLEAMKMRNEVTAPAAGVVRGIAVREGSNVRARETMMVIVPA